MEIYILILLAVLIVLSLTAIVLIIKNKPKNDNSITLLDQKLDINAKQSYEQMNYLSKQMQGLTEKNYEQQIKLI